MTRDEIADSDYAALLADEQADRERDQAVARQQRMHAGRDRRRRNRARSNGFSVGGVSMLVLSIACLVLVGVPGIIAATVALAAGATVYVSTGRFWVSMFCLGATAPVTLWTSFWLLHVKEFSGPGQVGLVAGAGVLYALSLVFSGV